MTVTRKGKGCECNGFLTPFFTIIVYNSVTTKKLKRTLADLQVSEWGGEGGPLSKARLASLRETKNLGPRPFAGTSVLLL